MSNLRQTLMGYRGSLFYRPKWRRMEGDYDLFEVLPDGAVIWKESLHGHENAIQRLVELSKQTSNEVRVMHTLTNTLIASHRSPA
jgi:hypothetical protein